MINSRFSVKRTKATKLLSGLIKGRVDVRDLAPTSLYLTLLRSTGRFNDAISLIDAINFSSLEIDNVAIDVVDGCNLRCIACPNSIEKPAVVPVSHDDIIARVKNIDVSSIGRLRLYRFGEPLFNKELPDILRSLKSLASPHINSISISTNGQHRNFSNLENSLKTGAIDILSISADGDSSKEQFEFMRPPARYDVLVDFIHAARELIDKYSPHTQLTMGIIIPPYKVSETYKVNKSAQDSWIQKFGNYIDKFDFHSLINMPGSFLAEEGRFKNIPYYDVPSKGACVSSTDGNIYIDGKGIVQPCCWAIDVKHLGDLNKQAYSEIFLNRLRLIEQLDESRSLVDSCSKCSSD